MPVQLTAFRIIVRLLALDSKGRKVVQMKTYLTLVGAFHSPQPWASPCLPSGRYCPNLTHPSIPTSTTTHPLSSCIPPSSQPTQDHPLELSKTDVNCHDLKLCQLLNSSSESHNWLKYAGISDYWLVDMGGDVSGIRELSRDGMELIKGFQY